MSLSKLGISLKIYSPINIKSNFKMLSFLLMVFATTRTYKKEYIFKLWSVTAKDLNKNFSFVTLTLL